MVLTPRAAASWRMVTASAPWTANRCSATSHRRSRNCATSSGVRVLGKACPRCENIHLRDASFYAINLQRNYFPTQESAMDGSQPINPYLTDNFAPVMDEADFDLAVSGQFPADLAGALYRNGPNPQFAPRDQHHWFAGDGMIHGFFVEDGKVRYRNRYVRTNKWRVENAAGRALFGTFGNPMTTDPSVLG